MYVKIIIKTSQSIFIILLKKVEIVYGMIEKESQIFFKSSIDFILSKSIELGIKDQIAHETKPVHNQIINHTKMKFPRILNQFLFVIETEYRKLFFVKVSLSTAEKRGKDAFIPLYNAKTRNNTQENTITAPPIYFPDSNPEK